jgi:cell filamentation protein, protein adenylyltransferase
MNRAYDKYDSDDRAIDPKTGLLRNQLGIVDQDELNLAEGRALLAAYEKAALEYSETHRFSEKDVRYLHRLFLGGIYDWAGEYRMVDISSEDIRWCHAKFIPQEMEKFSAMLSEMSPFSPNMPREELIQRLAIIHGELVVIHPFRDGNGRLTRFLCDLLLIQAERQPFGQDLFEKKSVREEYFAAIRAVWGQADYSKLIRLFDRLLVQS